MIKKTDNIILKIDSLNFQLRNQKNQKNQINQRSRL